MLGEDADSPGCAVHTSDEKGYELVEGSGVFMRELYSELKRRGIRIPFRGIRDSDQNRLMEDIRWIDNLLADP